MLIRNSVRSSDFFKYFRSKINEFENLLFVLNTRLPLVLISEFSDIIKWVNLIVGAFKQTIDRSFNSKHDIKYEVELVTSKSDIICSLCMFLAFFCLTLFISSSPNCLLMVNILNDSVDFSFFCTSWTHSCRNYRLKCFDSLHEGSNRSVNNINLFIFINAYIAIFIFELLFPSCWYLILWFLHTRIMHEMEGLVSMVFFKIFWPDFTWLPAFMFFLHQFFFLRICKSILICEQFSKFVLIFLLYSRSSFSGSSIKQIPNEICC